MKKASAHSVVLKYSNRREHREDTELTENTSASSVVNIPYLLLIIKASAHSVVKNYSNRREHREDTELTENTSASSVVKNSKPLVDEESLCALFGKKLQ
jgi:hypothetical protein